MIILPRYILKQHIGPLLFANLVIIFIFLTNWLMQNLYKLVGKGLSFPVIIEIIALNMAWILTLSVPMSVLMATLTAYGKLSQENEITAMRAGGISSFRLIAIPLIASFFIMVGMIYFNNNALPWSNHRLKNLMADVYRKKPALNFQNGVFSDQIPGYQVLIKRIDPDSPQIHEITIFDYSNPDVKRSIIAKTGTLEFADGSDQVLLLLYNGEIHDLQRFQPTQYQRVIFDKHLVAIPLEGLSFKRTNPGRYSDREMSAAMMREYIAALRVDIEERNEKLRNYVHRTGDFSYTHTQHILDSLNFVLPVVQKQLQQASVTDTNISGDSLRIVVNRTSTIRENIQREFSFIRSRLRIIDQYALEIQKKYSIPAACIVFVLIGAPLGIVTRKGGLAVGGAVSLGFFILYWSFLIAGEDLSDRGLVSPFLAMWLPNILIGLAGAALTYRVITEQPVGFKSISHLIRFRRPS